MATFPIVAAPSQQIVARIKGALTASATPSALVAASAPVEADARRTFGTAGLGGKRQAWQDELWELYDEVGEFAYYAEWLASSCSRVQWIASEIGADGRPTGGIADDNTEGRKVAEMVADMAGGILGQAELTERAVRILAVPGEHWIGILKRPDGDSGVTQEKWFALTREEIGPGQRRSDGHEITLPDGKKHEWDPDSEGLFRVWNPHPRKAVDATSPARSSLPALREIARTTAKIRNVDGSRMNNNGLLVFPSEADLPSVAAPVSADKPGDTPESAPRLSFSQSLAKRLVDTCVEGSKNPNSAASIVPNVITAPGEFIKNIQHIDFGKDLTDLAIKTRNDAIERFAMGVNMSPERLRGLSGGNHWASNTIGDSDVQLHIAPMMETLLGAIDLNVLRDNLRAENIDPDKYILWYDTSGLTVDPDHTDEAKDLLAAGAISSDAAVRLSNLPADSVYDLDTPEGVKVWARDMLTKNPALIRTYGPLFKGLQGIDFPEPAALPTGAGGGNGPRAIKDARDESEKRNAERGKEPFTEGDDPRPIAASASPLSVAVEFGVTKALDLAGKRRVKTNDTTLRARLRGVEPHEYHRYMGPVTDGDVPGLIKGWDPGLDDLAGRYGFDADQVRLMVAQRARRQLTAQVVDGQIG